MAKLRRMSRGLRGRLLKAKQQDWRWKRFKSQKGRCAYCSVEMLLDAKSARDQHRLCTLDHKIPRSRDGADHWENSVAACHSCNQAKSNMTDLEFRKLRKEQRQSV